MNRILAAFMFFTRLPFWRIKQVPAECFKHVVNYWSFAGWLTGGIMALVYYLTAMVLPLEMAVIMALISRLLVTGALHEDGLADFCDGFGGGRERSQILTIMKDSHIGSYGVIGLICYFLSMYVLISNQPFQIACIALVTGDAWSKFVASNIINFLPYARKEEESKARTVYERMHFHEFLLAMIGGCFWMVFLMPINYWVACLLPVFAFFILIGFMRKKLQGYTGDCCGATFLICELTFYIGLHIAISQISIL